MEYLHEFNRLARYAPEEVRTNAFRQAKFLRGLKDELSIQIVATDYADFQRSPPLSLVPASPPPPPPASSPSLPPLRFLPFAASLPLYLRRLPSAASPPPPPLRRLPFAPSPPPSPLHRLPFTARHGGAFPKAVKTDAAAAAAAPKRTRQKRPKQRLQSKPSLPMEDDSCDLDFLNLVSPDLVRAATVSRSWRRFGSLPCPSASLPTVNSHNCL
ncbi:hypothetical protein GUJ93_ZPchr0011g27244 [Zizania palustris]|uniref:F-box domain-containing protein n=1 Tax=Zizania palustris TaxID=103762 RepID=A0A8J6BS44_ZIZPA|nr:hypothetical protein GUJ93_ZPchr0011g27244 [Zizania palustris]